jgi:hypothetical protein
LGTIFGAVSRFTTEAMAFGFLADFAGAFFAVGFGALVFAAVFLGAFAAAAGLRVRIQILLGYS